MLYNKRIEVPAGTYVLGDPCYCFADDSGTWEELLEITDYFRQPLAELLEGIVLGFPTAHGDGIFFDNDGYEYPVDSGMIGLVSIELVEKAHFNRTGRVVVFDAPTECKLNDARLKFGKYVIDTDTEEY